MGQLFMGNSKSQFFCIFVFFLHYEHFTTMTVEYVRKVPLKLGHIVQLEECLFFSKFSRRFSLKGSPPKLSKIKLLSMSLHIVTH